MLNLTATVLRDPGSLLDEDLTELAPKLLLIAAVGAGIFGAVVGSYRGGIQLVYAAIKMPALLLIPLVVGLPAVRALFRSCDVDVKTDRIALAGLAGMARTGVLAAAIGPVLWLLYSLQIDYHLAVLLMACCLGIVGLPGLMTVRIALPRGGERRWLAVLGSLGLMCLITMQTGWVLRPFVARPTAEVAFLRTVEADIFSSLGATGRSAVGDYSETWEAEESGFVGRGMRKK